jgi:hypothetical protein
MKGTILVGNGSTSMQNLLKSDNQHGICKMPPTSN